MSQDFRNFQNPTTTPVVKEEDIDSKNSVRKSSDDLLFRPKLVLFSPRDYKDYANFRYARYRSEVKFWSKVSGTGDDCWLWTGSTNRSGYGQTSFMGKHVTCHRLSYALANGGEFPIVVRHRCDTPLCVNPTHLVPGDHLDNFNDMRERGRYNPGGSARPPIMFKSIGM